MKQANDSFQTTDGLKIHTVAWLPEGEAQAVVLIAHGLGEHIGRYAHVADYLVGQGYAVYGLDHRGHGHSEGQRAYFESFDQPVADLKQYFDRVKAAQPGKKVFLYGHSQGSLIGLVFVLRYQDELAGYICSGAPLEIESAQSPLLVAASGVLNRLVPRLELPPLTAKYLSHDPAVVSGYETDPLVYHGGVHVRTGYNILTNSRELKRRAGEIRLPLLIVHGGSDAICPPSGSEVLYRSVGSGDKTLKIYPNLYHEVHNEPEQDQLFADIGAWLKARV